jgi:hypothetical protein
MLTTTVESREPGFLDCCPAVHYNLRVMSVSIASKQGRSLRLTGAIIRRRLLLATVCLLIVFGVPSEGYLGQARSDFFVDQATGSHGFRLGAWEVQALAQKAHDLVTRPGSDLTPQAQHDQVATHFDAIGHADELNSRIGHIYADPKELSPRQAAAPLQAELDALRATQAERRPAVEWIIEQQTAIVLHDQGLDTAGAVWPPVRFQFTESPYDLIVSPRERIVVERTVWLDPALPVSTMEQIETRVESGLAVSALVEGTGGFSAYPTMVVESTDLEWVLSTVAHEWVHTYMFFRPLGWHYADSGETRTMNETTASIVGDEIGRLVLERFYPEKVPPPDLPRPLSMLPESPAKPKFGFGEFMRETRLTVDQLLAQGHVEEAEAYMEAQRQELTTHGYYLRKLNQAYFAFHGSYAVGPSATDPIGGKLRALRHSARSLAAFVHTVARLTSVAELDAALGVGS